MGAAGAGAPPQGNRRVRDTLWLELGAGEGITAGVPMLCWSLYAEQKMNKVVMVEEVGIGVEMVGWQQELVKAEEVEAR